MSEKILQCDEHKNLSKTHFQAECCLLQHANFIKSLAVILLHINTYTVLHL